MTVGRGPRLGADGVNAINEETGGAWAPPLLAPLSGVWKLVKPAGRQTSDVKLRPVFASGLPGPSYGQKTNLNPTTGDPWVRPLGLGGLLASDDLLQTKLQGALDNLVARGNRCWLGLG